MVDGRGRLDGPERVIAETGDGEQTFDADVVLIATGAHPRDAARGRSPTGSGSSTWTQVYALDRAAASG